jgi:hypothetical protein
MEVSNQLHTPAALPLGKSPGIWGWWAPEPVWMLRNKENLLPLTGMKPRPSRGSPLLYRLSYPGSYTAVCYTNMGTSMSKAILHTSLIIIIKMRCIIPPISLYSQFMPRVGCNSSAKVKIKHSGEPYSLVVIYQELWRYLHLQDNRREQQNKSITVYQTARGHVRGDTNTVIRTTPWRRLEEWRYRSTHS